MSPSSAILELHSIGAATNEGHLDRDARNCVV